MESITQEMLSVEEKQISLQKFSVADYCIFATMVLLSSAIGLFYAFKAKSKKSRNAADDYLLGEQGMSVFTIALSAIASDLSTVTILGVPSEVYLYGVGILYVTIGGIIACFLTSYLFLPVFLDLRFSSINEYLGKRFDKKLQYLGSVLFLIGLITWAPVVIYLPAITFNQITGLDVKTTASLMCAICIFYTCLGGLKAVIWTDLLQLVFMLVAILAILIKGVLDVGHIEEIWERGRESGRIEILSIGGDPTIRHSLLSTIIGGCFSIWPVMMSQMVMQRLRTVPTIENARTVLWIFGFGILLAYCMGGGIGLIAYARYFNCDPATTGLIHADDQILPMLAMEILGKYPGMLGLITAGLFSASLSSLSAAFNSTAAIVLGDLKTIRSTPLSERATCIILRAIVVLIGSICLALSFLVEMMGPALQLVYSMTSVAYGAAIGLFIAGMMLPWINVKGALWGGILGIILNAVIVMGAQWAQITGGVVHPNKVTSVEGCDYSFTATMVNATHFSDEGSTVFPLFRVSYQYYVLIGALVTVVISLIVSCATGGNNYRNMDPRLFSPIIRRLLGTQNFETFESKEMTETFSPIHDD